MINIAGLDKAQLLLALHGRARKPPGETQLIPFTLELARKHVNDRTTRSQPLEFKVLHGRELFIDITGDGLTGHNIYDACNGGEGSCLEVVEKLRS